MCTFSRKRSQRPYLMHLARSSDVSFWNWMFPISIGTENCFCDILNGTMSIVIALPYIVHTDFIYVFRTFLKVPVNFFKISGDTESTEITLPKFSMSNPCFRDHSLCKWLHCFMFVFLYANSIKVTLSKFLLCEWCLAFRNFPKLGWDLRKYTENPYEGQFFVSPWLQRHD